jgi:hypothetical protein
MDREALVYVDLDGVPHPMGRLGARTRKNKESATFEYDKTWLVNPARFSLEPALQVGPGPFHTLADTPMFGAIGDSAPDRWGRALILGTLLVASGTGTLNQYIERRFDAQMRRTARRPLAAGRLNAPGVLWFGVALSAVGIIYLAIAVNVLASLLALVTLLSYVFLYAPLKRKTPLRTLVEPFTGAILR